MQQVRNVRPEIGCELGEAIRRRLQAEQPVHRHERRGGIARAAGQAGAGGDALADADGQAHRPVPDQQLRRPDRQVAPIGRQARHVHGAGDAGLLLAPDQDLVVEGDRDVGHVQLVEAVVPLPQHLEHEVHLGRGAGTNGVVFGGQLHL